MAVVQAASSLSSPTQRVFYIPQGFTVVLKNLELRYGYAPSSGAIDGGAIECSSNLTILNCYIHDNVARQGCGIDLYEGSGTTYLIDNSTIANNVSTAAQSGLFGAGILLSGGNLTLTNSTVYNNSGVQYGGGIYIRNTGKTITITNCTITNNSAQNYDGSNLGYGGGIGIQSGTLNIKNTIVANNSEGNVSNNGGDIDHFGGTITDNGYNIIEVENSASIPVTGDITGNQSNLFGTGVASTPALAVNNTSTGTPTLKTTSGSVAINAGNNTANGSVSIPSQDQRGADRNGSVDIGAYEYWDDAGALPVELSSFTAKANQNKVNLNWQTATELNNYGYEIESSSAGTKSWNKIGFVKGNGNSYSPKKYSFTDENPSSSKMQYRLKQIDNDGKFEYSKVVDVTLNTPAKFSLEQNYPNPFNPTTKIKYAIPSDNFVQIKIYNILGKEVMTLLNEYKKAGTYSIEFNASSLSSGVYFYKIISGRNSEIKKMILLK